MDADASPPPVPPAPVPAVLTDLLARFVHACSSASWQAQLGGAAGIGIMAARCPAAWLRLHATGCVKGLLAVLRSLPDHAVAEAEDVADNATRVYVVLTCA